MKKKIPESTKFLLTYAKGISIQQKLIDGLITLFAWSFWLWLAYGALEDYLAWGSSYYESFLTLLLDSFKVAMVVAGVLILTGLYNVFLFFRDQKKHPELGEALPLEVTATYFELDQESAMTARREKMVDVEVDEMGKVVKVTKHNPKPDSK